MTHEGFGFSAYEYLEGYRESLSTLKFQTAELLERVNTISIESVLLPFKKKCTRILCVILDYCDEHLALLNNPSKYDIKELLEIFSSYVIFDNYSEALRTTEKSINQRVKAIKYDDGFFPEFEYNQFGSRISNAIDNIVEYLMTLFFPHNDGNGQEIQNNDSQWQIIPITIFGDSPKHETWSHFLVGKENLILYVVNMPSTDIHRFRFWTSMGHEITHLKLLHTYQSCVLNSPKILMHFPYSEEGQSLYDCTAQGLCYEIGEAYTNSKVLGDKYSTNLPNATRLIAKQVEELICDSASIIIFGIPSLLTLICSGGLPYQGLKDICDHPPLPIRVNHMLKCLRNQKNPTPKYLETLNEIEHEWNSLLNQFKFDQYTDLLEAYQRVVDDYSQYISDFANKYIVSYSDPVEPIKWDKYISTYDVSCSALNDSCKDPVSCLIRAWAKRWITYKKLCETGKTNFNQFCTWHKSETKIYGQLINEMNRL